MCGIVGYIGEKDVTDILISGLKRLEYRGYDSAGVAVYDGENINVVKTKGRLSVLEEKVMDTPLKGKVGIGHTRWATHGEPSDINAHPHLNKDGSLAVVHNGIIENYLELKNWLKGLGYEFISDTDTEVISHLLDYYYEGDVLQAVLKLVSRIEGSYALGVLSKNEPDKIVAVRKDSPLIVGLGEGENLIASDIPALLPYTRNVVIMADRDIAVLTKDRVTFYDYYGREIEKPVTHIDWDISAAEKGGYRHFMLKEINEQPRAIRDTLRGRITEDGFHLDDISLDEGYIKGLKSIQIVACGTAYHAGLVAKEFYERYIKIPTVTDIASEFRYRDPLVDKNVLTIVISQSGETADTIAAIREAKSKGSKVFAITNVLGSTVARESDYVLYTWAGPEIAVASTKAYITQLAALYMLGGYIGLKRGTLDMKFVRELQAELTAIPDKVQKILDEQDRIQRIADEHYNVKDVFYLGRGLDYAVSMEGSLKLKEVSYIHSEAYPAGELKHGTLALVEDGTLIIAVATQKALYEKTLSNIEETKTRGGYIITVTKGDNEIFNDASDEMIMLPTASDYIMPIITVVPLQLLAYYMAVARGCDVDKPRNLAKSVTVE
ncbi:glutamine--fructose-6-phosphate transaminase (isomerizing) [Calorimonas adulescens]|uniref:Glutamine--fructose-6-phosphate aminotransferase [isomerizing] n=1 Tax=Calorimonas adulescens TaxID=2606906 RepID=A0A5D8QF21_9THEO|nr:glutamine--fructose-6-phosphate transaminase (isomerizing) [Calorimonas adulescens]TZE82113.1 glutamine--fructose-6-phosphate transaminase (isomerizing) [Calorimonas adulescens]